MGWCFKLGSTRQVLWSHQGSLVCSQGQVSKGALLLGVGLLAAGATGVTGPHGNIGQQAARFVHKEADGTQRAEGPKAP